MSWQICLIGSLGMDSSKMDVEKWCWETIVEQQPGLAEAVRDLVQAGQTPTQIESFVRQKGRSALIAGVCGNAAAWLMSHD
jgi:hypothetical protein